MIRIIPPQVTQAIYTLVMAEPTAIPARGFIGRPKASTVLAMKSTQILFNAELYQGCTLALIQLTKPGRLIRSDSYIFHDISFLAPRGALSGERVFPLGV